MLLQVSDVKDIVAEWIKNNLCMEIILFLSPLPPSNLWCARFKQAARTC